MFTEDDNEQRCRIMGFIRSYIDRHGFAPSVREIGRAVGISSTKAVKYHLDILVRNGKLERSAGKARSLKVVDWSDTLPLIGRIAAGSPVLAVENIEGRVSLSRFRGCFLLRVHGESMVGAGIFENDLVIVRPQGVAKNGEIVVALIGDEATVKRLRYLNGKIWLYPENPRFQPIVIEDQRDNFHLIGVVVGLLRNYQ